MRMTHNQSADDREAGFGDKGSAVANAGNAPQVPVEAARMLPPAALRALDEAEARRRARDAQLETDGKPVELGGREGPDPVRYGDWEKGGIVSDF